MLCQVNLGLDAARSISIEADGTATLGTAFAFFSYDAPVTSYTATPNAPTSGGSVLTVYGQNFGSSDPSGTVRFGVSACAQITWSSESAMKCMQSPDGAGKDLIVQVTYIWPYIVMALYSYGW